MTVSIVGSGAMAMSLCRSLCEAGVSVLGVKASCLEYAQDFSARMVNFGHHVKTTSQDPSEFIAASDVIIVARADSAIVDCVDEISPTLRDRHILLHTAGGHAAEKILGEAKGAVAAIGTMHPLISLTREAPRLLQNAYFAIEGDDKGKKTALALVAAMGARSFEIEADQMPLYHAGAIMASNYVIGLQSEAIDIFKVCGVSQDVGEAALATLLQSVSDNFRENGLQRALTGPHLRGDTVTIEEHRKAIKNPETLKLYDQMGSILTQLKRKA